MFANIFKPALLGTPSASKLWLTKLDRTVTGTVDNSGIANLAILLTITPAGRANPSTAITGSSLLMLMWPTVEFMGNTGGAIGEALGTAVVFSAVCWAVGFTV